MTTVKVTSGTRDRLATLAREAGQSTGSFLADVANGLPTEAELDARDERVRRRLVALGHQHLTPDARSEGEAMWAALDAGDDQALVKAAATA
uniref:hypothetical protein n=1 Tax=Amycolatopsis sp. CA-096443 TaxID=3239919 RepID=UPI003F494993